MKRNIVNSLPVKGLDEEVHYEPAYLYVHRVDSEI